MPGALPAMKRAGVSVRARLWERKAERMAERAAKTPPPAPALDTLGLLASTSAPDASPDVSPGSAAGSAAGKFQKRARGKYLSQHLALALVDVENKRIERGELPPPGRGRNMLAAYWRSYHCGSELRKENGKLVTTLCRCRWCTVCAKIETARLIKLYGPVIKQWPDAHFVTLTARAVQGARLRETIRERNRIFATIVRQFNQRFRRGLEPHLLRALRKLETTYNDARRTFHPHLHVLTATLEEAEFLRREWLRHYGDDAVAHAQDIRKADEGTLLELFKYLAKLTAGGGKANNDAGLEYINAEALNEIFHACAGMRTFEAYGVGPLAGEDDDAPDEELDELAEAVLDRGERWLWNRAATDWVEVRTGEFLTNYRPSDGLRDLVERRILRGRPRRGVLRPDPPPKTE